MADQMPASFVPDAAPAAAPAGMPSSFVPDAAPNFKAQNEPPSPSMWTRANTPLVPQIADAAHAIADHLDQPKLDRSETEAKIRGFLAGATTGAGDVAASFTSPIGLALTLSGLSGDSAAVKAIPGLKALLDLPAIRVLQRTVQTGAGAGFGAEGVSRMVNEPTLGGKAEGLVEAASGAAGVASGMRGVPTAVVQNPIVQKVVPQLVRHGSTAAGAYLAGPAGAIVGSGVGEALASPLEQARAKFQAAKAARQAPPAASPQPQPVAAAPVQVAPPTAAAPPPTPVPTAVAAPVQPTPQPPAPAPIATPAPAPPQSVAVSPQAATNALGLAAARAKVPLTLKEIRSLVPVVQQGTAPAAAIAAFVQSKDPAAALAKMPGMMTDAEVQAALDARNNAGKIKTPSAETARARKAAQP